MDYKKQKQSADGWKIKLVSVKLVEGNKHVYRAEGGKVIRALSLIACVPAVNKTI